MQRKSFSKISITEICGEAGVGRKTFYRNFDMKEDVVEFQLDILCREYAKDINGKDEDALLHHHFQFVSDYAPYFISLYVNGLHQFTYEKFSIFLPQTMPKWSEDPVEQRYHSQYVIFGIEAVQRVWVERNFQESVDEIIEIVRKIQTGRYSR